jgi:hypothetical protein
MNLGTERQERLLITLGGAMEQFYPPAEVPYTGSSTDLLNAANHHLYRS